MTGIPYFPFYPADYMADTLHLTTEQHGAYLLLLMAAWPHGGRLPNDPKKLARIARVSSRRWHLVAEDVLAFFEVDGDEIVSKRLERERKKADSISAKRSASARREKQRKPLKNNKTAQANAEQVPTYPEPEPDIDDVSLRSTSSPREDLDGLSDRLCEAAGITDATKTAGLLSLSDPLNWLANGCDLDADILPTLRRVASGRTGIRSWSYFSQAVFEARDRRLAPGPAVSSNNQPSRRASVAEIAMRRAVNG